MLISNIKKDYGTLSTVVMYRREFSAECPECTIHHEKNCQICFKRGKYKDVDISLLSTLEQKAFFSKRKSSARRSKTCVTDYALANEFSQFITLTFNQKLTDSFNYDLCKKLASKWINNQRRTSPHLTYILVSEKHKSGAIHFHMIVNNFNGEIKEARNAKSGRLVRKNGKQIYNLTGWKYGFSTLSNISNKKATAYYLQKYLTKDFIEAFNKKRYWCSRGLKKPIKSYNIDCIKELNDYPPLFRKLYQHENYYLYTFTKGPEVTKTPDQIRNFARSRERAIMWSH